MVGPCLRLLPRSDAGTQRGTGTASRPAGAGQQAQRFILVPVLQRCGKFSGFSACLFPAVFKNKQVTRVAARTLFTPINALNLFRKNATYCSVCLRVRSDFQEFLMRSPALSNRRLDGSASGPADLGCDVCISSSTEQFSSTRAGTPGIPGAHGRDAGAASALRMTQRFPDHEAGRCHRRLADAA